MWQVQTSSINYDLKWSIVCKAHSYTEGITKADPESLLNTNDKLVFNSRHMNKFALTILKKN